MKQINSPDAPIALGAYSQAIQINDFIFCSGQIGINPKTQKLVQGGIEAETKQVLQNLLSVLQEAGAQMNQVVKVDIFLRDIKDFTKVNAIYLQFFPGTLKPARQTVEVSGLPKNALVEISCIAHKI